MIEVRKTTLVNKAHPEWGTWGVIEDCGEWYEIRNDRSTKVLFKSDLKDWEIVS